MKNFLIFLVSFFYISPLMAEIALKCNLTEHCRFNYEDKKTCWKKQTSIFAYINKDRSLMEVDGGDLNYRTYQINETTFEYFGFDVSSIKDDKIPYYLDTMEYLKENYNDNFFNIFNDKQERLTKIFEHSYEEFKLHIYDLNLILISEDLTTSAVVKKTFDYYSCEKIDRQL